MDTSIFLGVALLSRMVIPGGTLVLSFCSLEMSSGCGKGIRNDRWDQNANLQPKRIYYNNRTGSCYSLSYPFQVSFYKWIVLRFPFPSKFIYFPDKCIPMYGIFCIITNGIVLFILWLDYYSHDCNGSYMFLYREICNIYCILLNTMIYSHYITYSSYIHIHLL